MPQLAELYSPIADDLKTTARVFNDELVSDQGFIADLCQHVAHFHGKQLRPALVLLVGRACGDVRHEHHVTAAVTEMVHLATLVHDDVLDDADIRRRAATVNRLWGNERAVLMGDFLMSHAFHLCCGLESQFASRVIGVATNTVCEGEMMQVANRYNYDLTPDLYFDIIMRKTASLIGACCYLGAHYAGALADTAMQMREYGVALGVAFQVTDDLLDLIGDEAEVGKSLGRDIDEGKLTLPMIHYLAQASDAEKNHMRALCDSADPHRHAQIASILLASDSVEFAQQTARDYIARAQESLACLPDSEARDSLATMAGFVLERSH